MSDYKVMGPKVQKIFGNCSNGGGGDPGGLMLWVKRKDFV